MFQPIFFFDPQTRFSLLELILVGTNGATTVRSAAVPKGLNRVILIGGVFHNEAATSHVVNLVAINPQANNSFPVPMNQVTLATGLMNPILSPFILPEGWFLQAQVDAIAAGSRVQANVLYLDYLQSVGQT